jgi:hypothetical protein
LDIHARVRYVNDEWRNRHELPYINTKESRHANTSEHEILITDARSLAGAGSLDLDTNGFVLTDFPITDLDFHDEEVVKNSYKTRISPFFCEVTGAESALVTNHIVRTEDQSSYINAYARFVHADYPIADEELERRVMFQHGLGESVDQFDYAWFNIWAPIDRKVEQNALALVDAATINADEVVDYFFSDSANAIASVPIYDHAHRFYYFSNMEPGEALVFKQLDRRAGKARMCPHTAFYDTSVTNAPGRRSVEIRALCLFPR